MSSTDFKRLCILSLVLLVFGIYATFTADDNLPPALAQYVEAQLESDFGIAELILVVIGVLTIAANVGILFLARWARPVFTAGIFISTAGMVFLPPTVYTPLESALYEVGLVIDGVIIGIMYFTDIKHEFTRAT